MNGFISTMFPDFRVIDGYFSNSIVVLRIASQLRGNRCPECRCWTERVHSYYYRTVQDVPMYGASVFLRVRARKFFCHNPECPRTIFTEHFDGFLAESQRKTTRLNELLTQIGFSLGGNPGAALCQRLGVSVAKDTLLRRVKAFVPKSEDVEVIGIDDWAYRRGQRYGTLICDLKHHRLVDVLPDRSVSTVANWLKAHPTIQVVSRDRAGAYADAIRQGLPSAIQVADRWHLLKNLSDAVERYLTRHRLPPRETQDIREREPRSVEPSRPTRKEQEQSERRQAKWERVQQVQQLRESGLGIRAISRKVGLSRKTVRSYLTWTEVPKTVRRPRATLLDPYRQQIAELLNQSLSGPVIFRKIQEQGYRGSRSTLGQYLADLRRSKRSGQESVVRRHRISPRSAARLLTRSDDKVDEEDKPYLKLLLEKLEGAEAIRNLSDSFRKLLEKHDRSGLDNWLSEAMTCGVRELRTFAQGIQRDYEAVAAGIAERWSNGQVEGQVNRLKTLKRQMYGRAGFALLRARVLYHG